jgi:dihydrofolate reductase
LIRPSSYSLPDWMAGSGPAMTRKERIATSMHYQRRAAMPHIIYFAAISLDGRLAGAGDDLAFLGTLDGGFRGTEYDMERLIAGFDSLVMGAATFRVIRERIAAGLHPQWPYGDRPSWIVTHAAELAPVPGPSALRRFFGNARELLAEVETSGARRTWLVGGGNLAAQLLAIDGVDELILVIAPSILGRGPALADGPMPLRGFRLDDVRRDASSLALRYVRVA